MPVTNSTTQISEIGNGHRYVVERHYDQDSREVGFLTWTAGPDVDIAAVVAARVAQIDEQLAQAEFDAIVEAG
jgi:hypothetical protein